MCVCGERVAQLAPTNNFRRGNECFCLTTYWQDNLLRNLFYKRRRMEKNNLKNQRPGAGFFNLSYKFLTNKQLLNSNSS